MRGFEAVRSPWRERRSIAAATCGRCPWRASGCEGKTRACGGRGETLVGAWAVDATCVRRRAPLSSRNLSTSSRPSCSQTSRPVPGRERDPRGRYRPRWYRARRLAVRAGRGSAGWDIREPRRRWCGTVGSRRCERGMAPRGVRIVGATFILSFVNECAGKAIATWRKGPSTVRATVVAVSAMRTLSREDAPPPSTTER